MPAEPPVASSMISGPDLGGGYLHQLTVLPNGDGSTFTFHAQDGGSDAGGPPKGPLDVFGFDHPKVACMYGGARCWHREFRLPFGQAPRVRAAYNRTRFTLETMIAQAFEGRPVDIDGALAELVDRISTPLSNAGVEWYIGGSTAARLLGAPVAPRDIDLGTTEHGVELVGEALLPYLIEPVAPTHWSTARAVRAGRAFLGTLQEGARVEWSVPATPRDPARFEEFSGRAGVARLVEVPYRSGPILVSRPEYGLVRAAERRRADAEREWSALVTGLGADPELLEALPLRSSLDPARQAAVRAAVGIR